VGTNEKLVIVRDQRVKYIARPTALFATLAYIYILTFWHIKNSVAIMPIKGHSEKYYKPEIIQ